MFRDVPGCSGMFRNVPACSGMFHVPDFIDGHRRVLTEGVLHASWHFRHLRLTGFFVYGEIRKCSRAVKAC